jgi:hypothetical protein
MHVMRACVSIVASSCAWPLVLLLLLNIRASHNFTTPSLDALAKCLGSGCPGSAAQHMQQGMMMLLAKDRENIISDIWAHSEQQRRALTLSHPLGTFLLLWHLSVDVAVVDKNRSELTRTETRPVHFVCSGCPVADRS